MTAMMTLAEATTWVSAAILVGDGGTAIHRVHTDTRSIQPGDLFVALTGEHFDGNDFLAQARAHGAVAAICNSPEKLANSGLPGLVVEDTKQALGELATGWRSQFNLPLIAVTGSNGKTTVTQMVAAILNAHRPNSFLATQGNFNNDIGLPLTLLRLRKEHQIAVVEIGMNHPGEILALAKIAKPTVALVNNAQREHQEFMSSVLAVAQENGEVFKALEPSGTAVFPVSAAYGTLWKTLAQNRPIFDFSLDTKTAAVHCEAYEWRDGAWSMHVVTPVGRLSFALHIAGAHNAANALAALACAVASGVPLLSISQGLETFRAVKGRSKAQVISRNGHALTLIDDSYNANPDSVRAAIEVLSGLPGPRLLVLGDMGEVGDQGPQFHQEVGAYAKARGLERVMTCGTLSSHAQMAFGGSDHYSSIEPLIEAIEIQNQAYATILVKGSRFMKMERVVEFLMTQSSSFEEAACS
jgi:UDP-N-acetylmuramoyl-tripeptide--D-alanyl-D-alanine ligase